MRSVKYRYKFGWRGGKKYDGFIKASSTDDAISLVNRKFDLDIQRDADWWEILFSDTVLRSNELDKKIKEKQKNEKSNVVPLFSNEKKESNPEVLEVKLTVVKVDHSSKQMVV